MSGLGKQTRLRLCPHPSHRHSLFRFSIQTRRAGGADSPSLFLPSQTSAKIFDHRLCRNQKKLVNVGLNLRSKRDTPSSQKGDVLSCLPWNVRCCAGTPLLPETAFRGPGHSKRVVAGQQDPALPWLSSCGGSVAQGGVRIQMSVRGFAEVCSVLCLPPKLGRREAGASVPTAARGSLLNGFIYSVEQCN